VCSLEDGRKSFYLSVHAIFGKVGRSASEEVTLQLFTSLLATASRFYSLTEMQNQTRHLSTIQFTVCSRNHSKLITLKLSIARVSKNSNFDLPSMQRTKRKARYGESDNSFYVNCEVPDC